MILLLFPRVLWMWICCLVTQRPFRYNGKVWTTLSLIREFDLAKSHLSICFLAVSFRENTSFISPQVLSNLNLVAFWPRSQLLMSCHLFCYMRNDFCQSAETLRLSLPTFLLLSPGHFNSLIKRETGLKGIFQDKPYFLFPWHSIILSGTLVANELKSFPKMWFNFIPNNRLN